MVLECSVQWLCLPGHQSRGLIIPVCQLLPTGVGGEGFLGTVRTKPHPFGQSWVIPGSWHICPCMGCGKNGLLRGGQIPWCWECPHPLSTHPSVPSLVVAPGCRVGAEEQSWGAGNPKSQSVGLWIELEWLGLSIPGAQDRPGGPDPLIPGASRSVSRIPCVSQG